MKINTGFGGNYDYTDTFLSAHLTPKQMVDLYHKGVALLKSSVTVTPVGGK